MIIKLKLASSQNRSNRNKISTGELRRLVSTLNSKFFLNFQGKKFTFHRPKKLFQNIIISTKIDQTIKIEQNLINNKLIYANKGANYIFNYVNSLVLTITET
jgi:hypothetical protein